MKNPSKDNCYRNCACNKRKKINVRINEFIFVFLTKNTETKIERLKENGTIIETNFKVFKPARMNCGSLKRGIFQIRIHRLYA